MRIIYGSGYPHHYSETRNVLWSEKAQEVGRILGPDGEPLSILMDREVIPFGYQKPEEDS